MDYLAPITHQKLALSRNPIVVNVDPVSLPEGFSRVDLRYCLQLHVQQAFQSGSYQLAATLEASERPPLAGSTSSAGAYFELQTRLHDRLAATLPPYASRQITVCPDLVRRYYYDTTRYNGDTLLDESTSVTGWVIRAGVSERDFDTYRELLFTRYLGQGRRFLTWQPDFKRVLPAQPEFLYFLTHFSPAPTRLLLRVRCTYTDRSTETFTALSLDNVSYMTVYALPVGYDQLGLGHRPRAVLSYEVWLSNQDSERVSEVRTYRLDPQPYESSRFLLFQNGLGGFDTLPCLGVPSSSVKVERQLLQRFTGYDYLFTVAEERVQAVSGEKSLTLHLGSWVSVAYRQYLQDLLFSDEFYLVDADEFVPLTPTFDALSFDNPREWPIERSLTFRYANRLTRYSQLPVIAKETRPTGWRQWTTSCALGANGLRTGQRLVNELVQYYLDSGENVRPLFTKPNLPGTEGYIAPWASDDCDASTTPFLSAAVSQASTRKRSGCPTGQVGSVWTIVVPAGAYGSEQSQADADAKARVRATELDTPANADLYGSCIPAVPVPLALHNLCPGNAVGYTGSAYNPIPAVLIAGTEHIGNTAFAAQPTYAPTGLVAGTYHLDVRCVFNNPPTLPYRIRIPSKNLVTGTLNGNLTHRFAHVVVDWGDADLIILVEPVP